MKRMKKYLYCAAAALALSACSSEQLGVANPNGDPTPGPAGTEQEAINFGGMTKAMTRAGEHVGSDAAGLLDKNFVVMGVKGDGTMASYAPAAEVFDHYNVNYIAGSANTTLSNSNDWEYVDQNLNIKGLAGKLSEAVAQTIKYWDYSTTQYDFVAVSMGKGVGTAGSETYAELSKIVYKNIGKAESTGEPVYTLTGTAEELSAAYVADLVTLYNRNGKSDYKNAVVTPKFRALGTKVRIALYETVPGYAVTNVKFYNEAWDGQTVTTASGAEAATLFCSNAIFMPTTGDGKMEVYYPTVGWTNSPNDQDASDYNKAHIKFTAITGEAQLKTNETFGTLTYTAGKEIAEKCTNILGRTSTEATYANGGAYTVVIPQGAGENIQLRIEYDLYPIDGGNEVIHVRDARAVVPAQYANWQPNYAYTYIFKISDQTNGWTGTESVPNPSFDPNEPEDPVTNPKTIEQVVEGLTPITFDAVVVDTEDGIQETITTVATPAFTTYMKGQVVTANNEYVAGDIYATIMDEGTATATGITLYVATEKPNTSAYISEATAELAYNQGKTDPASDTFDKTNVILTQVYGGTVVAKIPGVDGNDVEVPAYKWTAQANTVYVLRYQNAAGKTAYKVVRVQ